MSVSIQIPTPLRGYAEKQSEVRVEAKTIHEALSALTERYRPLKAQLYAEDGKLRSFVNVYLNDEDIRHLGNASAAVKEGDTITIVPSIAGGAGFGSVERPISLNQDEIKRYSRHLIMPEVGMAGQRKIKQAKVLLIGTGGLGSPAALYLAAAGVGKLGIVDFDVVDYSNLQRQIVHGTEMVGKPKIESAKARLASINPFVEVQAYEERFSSENAMAIVKDYDIVADGTDNFPTRYLTNDVCVLLGKPNVYASIFRFEGQASVFDAKRGPCYRCLYPEPPPPGLVPSCAEGGVLGILPGVMGVIQATEVIKLILGSGDPLVGRLMLFDALKMKFRELKLRKDPNCPICGPKATIKELIDYEQFCGMTLGDEETSAMSATDIPQMQPRDLKALIDAGKKPFILDVREPHEVEIAKMPGTVLIPLGSLLERMNELPQNEDIVIHCKTGVRSLKAARQLKEAGFGRVSNLAGGINAWADQVDPSVAKY